MRVAFAGTPTFALPTLEALAEHHQLVGVLTRPDQPSGRGRQVQPSAVKRAALARGLPLAQPATLREAAALETLAGWQAEVLVVVAYGQLLPEPVLRLPRYGCINVHASLLPRWRGAAPVQRALLAGDARTGVSIMQMDAGLDTGPVLLSRPTVISPAHTGASLHDELSILGAQVLIEALAALESGTLMPVPQAAEGVTYAPKLEKAEARLDWARDAASLERQVRAFTPWPVAETLLEGVALRILGAHVYQRDFDGNLPAFVDKSAENGDIVDVGSDHFVVRCGAGHLVVTCVQRPGGKVLPVREFAQGHPLQGRRLGV
ncbi:MAG: methionyl-tRNA formyltransferase [Gammaproteobacteria bacterium]|nr:methionyl-tRNA formyltransferase [Gammaproteobacteria bacterium]